MATLAFEFGTPICTASYAEAETLREVLTAIALGAAEHPPESDRPHRQEVPRAVVGDDGYEGTPAKTESPDDFHLKHAEARPVLVWALQTFSWMLEEIRGRPLDEGIVPVIRNCWSSVYREGDYHQTHSHPMAAFSGVYCVEAPDVPPPAACLDLLDPRPNINYYHPLVSVFQEDTKGLRLSGGDLVIFPGWLNHFVNPFRGRGVRITLSMNFDFHALEG